MLLLLVLLLILFTKSRLAAEYRRRKLPFEDPALDPGGRTDPRKLLPRVVQQAMTATIRTSFRREEVEPGPLVRTDLIVAISLVNVGCNDRSGLGALHIA